MSLTRRELLSFFLSTPAAIVRGDPPPLVDGPDDETGELMPVAEAEAIAEDLIEMELQAIKQANPSWWQLVQYTNLIRINDTTLMLYGVGTPAVVDAKVAEIRGWITEDGEGTILAVYVTACHRAWGIVTPGRVSDDVVKQMYVPAFKRGLPCWLQSQASSTTRVDESIK